MKKIAVYGAGGFGREVKMLIDQINELGTQPFKWEFVGFYDDGLEKGTIVNGFPVIGGVNDLNEIPEETGIVIAIGNPLTKKSIVEKINNQHVHYPTLIHPNALVGSDDVKIGEGSVICAGCLITVNIEIGKHVILNLSCTVGHDAIISDYCSFMPSVNISGEVRLSQCVYVGTGAQIINRADIGEETIVVMGAVVSKSLPPKCTAVGMPAKPIKFN